MQEPELQLACVPIPPEVGRLESGSTLLVWYTYMLDRFSLKGGSTPDLLHPPGQAPLVAKYKAILCIQHVTNAASCCNEKYGTAHIPQATT